MPITDLLERNSKLYGNEVALVEINPEQQEPIRITWKEYALIQPTSQKPYRREITWSVFDEKANRVANMLLSRGIKKGQKVAILLMNCLEWLPIYFGILKTGAIAVPLNFRYSSEEIEYCVNLADVDVLFFGPEFIGRVENTVLALGDKCLLFFVGDNCPSFAESYNEAVNNCPSNAPKILIEDTDEAAIYFSSGTTGFPKAILHNHTALLQAARMEAKHHATTHEDVFLCIPPLYHTGAKMHWFGSLYTGSRAVILKGTSPKAILDVVSWEQCTIVWLLVPWAQDILTALDRGDLKLSGRKLSQWRLMHIGAHQIISIKWSPNEENKNLLLCGDSKSTIKIWDIQKKKVISELKLSNENNILNGHKAPIIGNLNKRENKNYNVLGLDWNEENIIIATCNTSIYIINFIANKLILTDLINTQFKLFKIEFSPYPEEKQKKTFSVACSDGKIRIYEISKLKHGSNISPSKILSGHNSQIFGLSYKPFGYSKKYLLASGSDDYRVGIWDWTQSKDPKVKFLYGHTDKVRNVIWFQKENILISGSWDGIAFIWDINHYICLSMINKHKSDIYGIDTNCINPYLFATSSRDSSICVFNYDLNPIEHILLYKTNLNNNNLLNEEKHQKLILKLKNVDNNDYITKAEIITKYFLGYPCLKEFFDILRIIYHKSEHNTENNKIFHITDLYSAYKSSILQTEFDFNNSNISKDINKTKLINEAILKSAAINDWEKYCELNILINNWKNALMFAPKVSKKYWEELVIRYNQHLNEDKNNDDKLLFKLLESSITKDIKDSLYLLSKTNYKR